jgi:two-component system osmolarity sensor histidine kinase EnvZ
MQQRRIVGMAAMVATYIQGVREFAEHATPQQRQAMFDRLTLATDSRITVVSTPTEPFEEPSERIVRSFMESLRDQVSGPAPLWRAESEGDKDREGIGFKVSVPEGDALWLRYAVYAAPIPPWLPAALFGALLTLAIAAAAWLHMRLRPPLRATVEAIESIARGERPTTLLAAGAAEVSQLAHSVNDMARRLAQADDDRALMLAGVSHDLRTPLTKLRLGLELRPASPDDAQLVRAIDEIDRTIGQFVEFARADAETEAPVYLDPAELVREVAAGFELDGSTFALDLDSGAQVKVRPDAFRRVLTNLMNNAMRHGMAGLKVRVVLEPQDAGRDACVRIDVLDRGPGVSAENLARLGRPFYRTDEARVSTTGTGLGLALVGRLAAREGGTLILALRKDGGFCASILLPYPSGEPILKRRA